MTLSICRRQAHIARTWAGGDVILWWHFPALPVNGDNITKPNQTVVAKSYNIDRPFLSGLPRAVLPTHIVLSDGDNQSLYSKDRTQNIAKYLRALGVEVHPQKRQKHHYSWSVLFHPCGEKSYLPTKHHFKNQVPKHESHFGPKKVGKTSLDQIWSTDGTSH